MQFPQLGLEGLGLLEADAGGLQAAGEEGGDGQAEELGAGFGRVEVEG